ncbi:MAG: tetratricopeptide repeat protein [Planctomycetaceae bacterium]
MSAPLPTDTAPPTVTAPPTEGLPEWEPLTPELVEDEAIRGDFMLRWAVVLLALLIGCRQIVETTTLVHVKTGQYLASHGFWPPAHDVFSSTASEHRWVNLSWMWDLIASGLFAIGQGTGLSLATALLVALTWWLLGKTSRWNVSNWWGSILGALALLASHPRFSGQPETVTLLGLAASLWCWQSWRSSSDIPATASAAVLMGRPVSLWWLVPGFALWSNLDPRMFLGLLCLLLWGLGDLIGNALGRASLSGSQRKLFWKVLGSCVVASCLNPFGVQSLWSPVVLYATENPAWQNYSVTTSGLENSGALALWHPALWSPGLGRLPLIAGLLVLTSALVSLILNARRTSLGDVLVFVGFTALACVSSQELAAASIVACVLGTLNAQQWYQSKFRQTYSIATSELLFTRGGRAVTVLAFFVLAVLSVNQMLFGVDGKRVGLGLSNRLQALIEAYRSASENSFDNRPFNFVPQQGDLLLWVDQKPFVDSRLAVFSGRGAADLLILHEQARRALAGLPAQKTTAVEGEPNPTPSEDDLTSWRPIFDRFQITHAMPRLSGGRPVAYLRMLFSPDWRLTHLGGNCAVLYRGDTGTRELKEFLDQHRLSFVASAFQTESKTFDPPDWPRASTSFQKYLSPPEARVSNKVLEADNLRMHLHLMASRQISIEQPTAVAMAMLAIRKANEALADSADQAAAYQVLGDAYSFLLNMETAIQQSGGVSFSNQLRFYQALGAYHQAVLLEPDSLDLRGRLIDLLQRHNRVDLMLRELQAMDRLIPKTLADGDEADASSLGRLQLQEQCQSRLDALRDELEKIPDTGPSPLELAQHVYAAGFVLEALKLLDRDPVAVQRSPEGQVFQGLLRYEAGEIEEAYHQFTFEPSSSPVAWREPAAWTRLAHREYEPALKLWKEQLEINGHTSLFTIVTTMPLLQSPFQMLGQPLVWPTQHCLSVADAQFRVADEAATLLWYTAMSQLESGQPKLAGKTLSGLLEIYPETALRPLCRFYLFVITEELIDAEPPSEWIPIDGQTFMPDEASDEKTN